MRWSLVLAVLLAVPLSPSAQEPPCFENEACGEGQFCACFRNRNDAIGDCDEMGGMCKTLQGNERVSQKKLEKWKGRKAEMKARFPSTTSAGASK